MSDAPELVTGEAVELYEVAINDDLTEGRGIERPCRWTRSQSLALRMAHKRGVMGSDASVRRVRGIKVGNTVHVPVVIEQPTDADRENDAKIVERESALKRIRDAGVSDDDLRLLGVKP